MIVYTREKLQRLLKIDFIRFCIVGGTGFIINLVILTLLVKLLKSSIDSTTVRTAIAQFFGAEIALFSNFRLHNRWTYKENRVNKSWAKLLVQFHASSWPAILGSTAMVSALIKFFDLSELIALAISSVVALFWNFAWSKYVIWRDVSSSDVEKLVG